MENKQFTAKEALAQNPANPCPQEIMKTLGVCSVEYYGFDNQLHVGQMVVATAVMAEVESFFHLSLELGFPIEKVIPAAVTPYLWDDDKLMADNVSSGFNYRLIAGTNTPSLHAKGLAFDINPRQNPYIRYENGQEIVAPEGAQWDMSVQGTLYAEHPLVKLMEGYGWEWGGHWTKEVGRIDYQHFQKAIS